VTLAKSKNIAIAFLSSSSAELIKRLTLFNAFFVPYLGLKPNWFLTEVRIFLKI